MKHIFGSDMNMIIEHYNGHIAELAARHIYLKNVFSECVSRTGFLLPYMSAEYGYYSIKGTFMPVKIKEMVTGFGLIGLAISIDDDIADEYADNHLKMISNISVSELIQNFAYSLIFRNLRKESKIIMSETSKAVSATTEYQCADAANIISFQKGGFDITSYLHATKKTSCPIKYGLRLGMILAEGQEFIETTENIGERLGIVLQLIDDLLDLNDDVKNHKGNVTLPIFLMRNGQTFDKIFSMIDYSLDVCMKEAKKVPYSIKLEQMIKGFHKIKLMAKQRSDETTLFLKNVPDGI
ncbi:MAG: polyprenyl synthetase family protein [Candidatus Aenigmarchaeota archaeon]|nr:polyprenyl synthetase family protein [Candidatus Aenigmarchaeota archaeon]